jgi:hypothetical protein
LEVKEKDGYERAPLPEALLKQVKQDGILYVENGSYIIEEEPIVNYLSNEMNGKLYSSLWKILKLNVVLKISG